MKHSFNKHANCNKIYLIYSNNLTNTLKDNQIVYKLRNMMEGCVYNEQMDELELTNHGSAFTKTVCATLTIWVLLFRAVNLLTN